MKVALYVRVSTIEQATQGYSIGEQTASLKKYAEAMGWNDYKVFTDGGFSGSNLIRPALQELLRNINTYDKVIVYKLDRLSRSQKDTLYLIEDVFLKNNCDFISMNENFDTSSPFGKAMIGMLAVFAQLEREQIKERMKMGQSARAKKGLFHGSQKVPIGYDYIDGQLVVNENEKEQIITAYEMIAQGYSPTAIVRHFNESGMTTKYGTWSRSTLNTLLPKKTYLGFISYNGEWYKGTHEAFITPELYETCQSMIEQRHFANEKYKRRFGKVQSYLGGLLECGICGDKFTKKTDQYTTKSGKRKREFYGCNHRIRYHGKDRCTNKVWMMDDLDEVVFEELRKLKVRPIELAKIVPIRTDKQIEKIERQISKLLDLYSLDNISMDVLQAKIADLNDKKQSLIKSMADAKKMESERIRQADLQSLIESIDSVLESGDFEQIQNLLNTLIEKIVITGEDVQIFWAFE